MSTAVDRARRADENKFTARRRQLADSAIAVIAERGFARSGLRDIASHTELSTGILHYYFDGKDDLIAQAIWQYKSECARRYDPIIETATSAEEFVVRFTSEIAATLRDESNLHRLWYDLRNQALFESGFRDTIIDIDALLTDMVWEVVAQHARLLGVTPSIDKQTAYALFDGVFLNGLIAYQRGELDAIDQTARRAASLLMASV